MRVLEYPKDQKALRTPGRPVSQEEISTPEFQANLLKMFELLKQERNGIGLAATQVGWGIQLFILNCDENFKALDKEKVFINPIVEESVRRRSTLKDKEGCLSFKGLELKINRPDEIKWKYYDSEFQLHEITSQGYYARAILHETDHLLGKLFVDQASSTERLKFDKWLKLQ